VSRITRAGGRSALTAGLSSSAACRGWLAREASSVVPALAGIHSHIASPIADMGSEATNWGDPVGLREAASDARSHWLSSGWPETSTHAASKATPASIARTA